jgi:glycosyltransferase involved in cell wall biosynthesis
MLSRRGHDVVVFAPKSRHAPGMESDGVELRRAIRRGPFPQTLADVAEVRRLARHCAREFDVLVAHQTTNAVGLRLAEARVPLALVFHASAPLEQQFMRPRLPMRPRLASHALGPTLTWLERRAVTGADSILVLSGYSRRLVLDAYPHLADRVTPVSGGIDTDAFSPDRRADARERLNLAPEQRLLMSVRRFEPRMGLEELLRAAALLRDSGLEYALAVAGDGVLEPRLHSLARELRLDDRVEFLGRVPEDQLRDLYAAADLFVLPTVAYEGFGMVTAEALASGCPVVGTAVGATPELLAPLDPELVATTAAPEELARVIRRALLRSDESFRGSCAAYARRRFDWRRVIVEWEDALAALVEAVTPR